MRILALALAIASAPALGHAQGRMHMSFSGTSIGTVLKVIASKTGTNIVYAGKDGVPVTLDVSVDTAEEAIRDAVTASGLAYRKVRGTYIVASSETMRKALEPYTMKARYTMPKGVAAIVAPRVQEAYPDATVVAFGDRLVFTGVPDDLSESRSLILDLQAREEMNKPVNEVVTLGHSSPADILKLVSGLWPDLKAGSAGDQHGGAITLSGPAAEVARAKDFATQVDAAVQSGPAASIYKVYEIKYSSAPKLKAFLTEATKDVEAFIAPESYSPNRATFNPLTAAIAGSQGSGSGGAGSTGGNGTGASTNLNGGGGGQQSGLNGPLSTEEKDTRARRLVLRGTATAVDAAIALLSSIDVEPQQILVEVRVVEASPNLTENTGFNWDWSPIQFFEVPPGSPFGSDVSYLTRPTGVGQFSRAPLSFSSILNAKITKGEAKVLANPKIEVIDSDGASIFIGDTIRARIAQAGALGAQTIQIQEFPVGIILLIHPRINADGKITMHVNPVISTVTAISSDNIPQTSSREADTTVIVKDGETIVLGGLIQDQYSKTVSEVPFLSKLPIVGELFKNRSTSKKRTDVIITITPHIAKQTTGTGSK